MTLPKYKLISFALCPYVQRARIVLNEKNVEYELEYIDLDAPPEWFFDISPLEKVPVLLVDNKSVFESTVICEYLDEVSENSLHPEDPFDKAHNRAWMEFGNDLLSNTYNFFTTDDPLTFKQLRAKLIDQFDILEEELSNKPYFNGEKFSLVDAVYGPLFRIILLLQETKNIHFYEDTPNVAAWQQILLAHPSIIKSVPENYNVEMKAYLERQESVLNKQ